MKVIRVVPRYSGLVPLVSASILMTAILEGKRIAVGRSFTFGQFLFGF